VKLLTLLEAAAEFEANARDLENLGPRIVERAAVVIEKKATSLIGKNHDYWPPLAESTIKDEQHAGYAVPRPLLRSGEFRDSIQHVSQGNEACVGTDDPRGPWFEFGTSKMSPRPVLVPAAIASEDKIHRMVGTAAVAALSGHGRHARDVTELLRLLRGWARVGRVRPRPDAH
jgi:hypothetical protein